MPNQRDGSLVGRGGRGHSDATRMAGRGRLDQRCLRDGQLGEGGCAHVSGTI